MVSRLNLMSTSMGILESEVAPRFGLLQVLAPKRKILNSAGKNLCHYWQNCEIREFVTINSSTFEGTSVKVGDHCLIMAYCHIAHKLPC